MKNDIINRNMDALKMKITALLPVVCAAVFSCSQGAGKPPVTSTETPEAFVYDTNYVARGFDFPVGKPDGKGYYNAQPFTKNMHLGDDWNGKGGGNTDLGDTIYAIADGYISFAENIGGGWGNVIRIEHRLPAGRKYASVESVYAHMDTVLVTQERYVRKGAPIGTIGTAGGQYYAHLHLEIRHRTGMDIGGGYSPDTTGFLDPTAFIRAHRLVE